jgi:phenylacetate-CoA ligase
MFLWRAERWPQTVRAKHQLLVLNELIREGKNNVPLYRELYADVSEELTDASQLTQLPVITKQVLKANFPDKTTNSTCEKKLLYQIATSGTSDRVMVMQDETKRDWDRAADLLVKWRTEGFGQALVIPPDDCYERCGLGSDVEQQSITAALLDTMALRGDEKDRRQAISQVSSQLLWRQHILKPPGVDGSAVSDQVVDRYFQDIDQIKPTRVSALPYYFWMLANRSNGRQLDSVKCLRPNGGKATDAMVDIIEEALGVRFLENYGTAELGSISHNSPDNRHQVLFEGLFILEFVRRGAAVGPLQLGEILVTDLRNQATPLIRYQVGDVGRITREPDGEGRQQMEFEVCGRLDEVVVTPAGRAIPPDELVDFFLNFDGLVYFKIIQRSDSSFLLEVAHNTLPVSQSDLQSAFCEYIGYEVTLQVRMVRRVAPEATGKYKLVVSTSYDRFHEGQDTL